MKNFTETQTINIRLSSYKGQPLIAITQYGESMSFNFSMKPEQAREVAAALVAMADGVQPVELPEIEGVPA